MTDFRADDIVKVKSLNQLWRFVRIEGQQALCRQFGTEKRGWFPLDDLEPHDPTPGTVSF